MPAPKSPAIATPTFEERVSDFTAPERMDHLRARLSGAGREHLDAQWFTHDTPLGPLLVVTHGDRLVRVAFEREDFAAVQELVMDQLGRRTLRSDRRFEFVRGQLDEYFSGTRHSFSIPCDFALSRGKFRIAVQEHLPQVAYGTTVTYSELAAASGRPAAVRAAASACATNPLPIVVPCHRVVRTDGSTGAYLGGVESKRWLLRHEGALPGHGV